MTIGKVNYGALEKEQKAQKDRNSGDFVKTKWLSLKFGDNKFMVCPPKDGDSPWFFEITTHYGFNDSQGNRRAYQCTKADHGTCPICDQEDKLRDAGKINDANEIKGVRSFLFNVLHIEDENENFQNFDLKVLSAKPSQKNEILANYISYNKDEDVDAADLTNRRIFRGTRTKTDPWYTGRILNKQADITDEQIVSVLTNLHDLATVYVTNTPEELTKMLNGEDINVKKDNGEVESKAATTVETKIEDTTPTPTTTPEATTPEATTTDTTTTKKKLSTDELMAKLAE